MNKMINIVDENGKDFYINADCIGIVTGLTDKDGTPIEGKNIIITTVGLGGESMRIGTTETMPEIVEKIQQAG